MKKNLLIIICISLCTIVSSMQISAKETLYVNSKNGLNLRSKSSIKSDILLTMPFGSEVEVIKKKNDWYKVTYNEIKGYASSEYLQEENPYDDLEFLGNWHVTAYAYTGMPCANGNYPTQGYTVACNSLSFGTEIYIDGIGFRTVEDRGPSWLGSEWLDLYLSDHTSCVNFGSQQLDVYLVKE